MEADQYSCLAKAKNGSNVGIFPSSRSHLNRLFFMSKKSPIRLAGLNHKRIIELLVRFREAGFTAIEIRDIVGPIGITPDDLVRAGYPRKEVLEAVMDGGPLN